MQLANPPEEKSHPSSSKLNRRPIGKRRRNVVPEAKSEHSRLYSHLIPAYELFFSRFVRGRIWDCVRSLKLRPGAKVLEIGVGTGASLVAYPHDVSITGIDLSTEMLSVAQRRIAEEGWKHIQVMPMNAEVLDFPDASFDCVTAFHVVSVVSNPEKMMQEAIRVLRPGGTMLIINHFRSPRPWIANVVDRADPLTRHLGWKTGVECEEVVRSLPLQVERCYKTSPMSLFTVLKATRLENDQAFVAPKSPK